LLLQIIGGLVELECSAQDALHRALLLFRAPLDGIAEVVGNSDHCHAGEYTHIARRFDKGGSILYAGGMDETLKHVREMALMRRSIEADFREALARAHDEGESWATLSAVTGIPKSTVRYLALGDPRKEA